MTMKSDDFLARVRVDSPCHARWEDMAGDDRARFCLHCQQHVFNLSAMTQAEVEALVREKEGKFCGRFHRRRDGLMLTADCRTGRSARRWRLAKVLTAVLALATLTATGLAANPGQRSGSRGVVSQRIEGWIYALKVRLGIIKPITMGMICVPPPAKPGPTSPTSPSPTPPVSGESDPS